MKRPWHAMSVDEVVTQLGVDPKRGVDPKEAKRRLDQHGLNRLAEAETTGLFALFIKQFQDFMVLVLVGAAVVSGLLGELIDAAAIVAIVLLNAVLGCIQEYRAEKSLAALKEMAAPTSMVRRQGKTVRLAAAQLVPGDVILLKEGDRVPADARLLTATGLTVDEAALTGESVPVVKEAEWRGESDVQLAERRNMLFMGTSVSKGRGEAIVVATGMKTEIGDIAAMIQESQTELTPLQRRLEQLGRWLVAACLAVVALVFAAGVARGFSVYDMFLTGVSLAVAAIPEGLPAVVTVALALGVQRMIKQNAIVRRLPAVETLGCATIICTDKTGTLTKNEMTAVKLVLAEREIDVQGSGYEPVGEFLHDGRPVDLKEADVRAALLVSVHCNDAVLEPPAGRAARRAREGKGWRILGDPTEGALLVLARKGGIDPAQESRQSPRVAEIPFDSDRKRMSVVVRQSDGLVAYVKGAPDMILWRCRWVRRKDSVQELTDEMRQKLLKKAEAMAGGALRVLALAYRRVAPGELAGTRGTAPEAVETDLIFAGMVGMIDPPRPEVAAAIGKARRAGIETVMITGDHPSTAAAIGARLGLPSQTVVTGQELDAMDDQALADAVDRTRIFARVSPRHKLRIVRALKEKGHVVAMTGDGVNDAPAIKEADIGVAMGLTGTDVTREAAAMVLADDNYATLVAAVREGRGIYDNIRKFIRYLLACNTGEVLAMLIAAIAGMPMPLLPIQILWVNLVTDGLPAIALGVDPPESGVMDRPPRSPKEGVFARGLHVKIIARGALIGLATVGAFLIGFHAAPEGVVVLDYARTLAFTTLVGAQLVYVFQCRSEKRRLFQMNPLENPWLLLAVLVSFTMHVLVVYWPVLTPVFRSVPLSAGDWALVAVFSGGSQLAETLLVKLREGWARRISILRV